MVVRISKIYLSKYAKPKNKPYEIYDSALRGLVARIQPTGAITYYVTYLTPSGRRNRLKIANASHVCPEQARNLARQVLADVARGIDPKATKNKPERYTLKSFLNKVYTPWLLQNRRRGHEESRRIQAAFNVLLNKELSEISLWDIELWRKARLSANVSPSTVNRDFTSLRALINRAVEWGFINRNPIAGKVKKLPVDNSRARYLSEAEKMRLAEVLKSEPPLLRTMIVVSLNTGLRRGELFSLRWDNVSLNERFLTVHSSNSKNGKTRHVPLNDAAWTALFKWKNTSSNRNLVFPNKNGNPFSSLKKSWFRLTKHARINDFKWHDMRHDFASRLVMAGVDLNTVRELLGHSDINMTLRYAHISTKHKETAINKVNFR